MKPILLAFSLIRVPKLFVTLLFWPLVVGTGVALTQLLFTSAYLKLIDESPKDFEERIRTEDEATTWLRRQLYGTEKRLPAIAVCRWEVRDGREVPPSEACSPQPLDVVMRVADPASFETADYERYFDGSVRKLHICKECKSDVVVTVGGSSDETVADVGTLAGLGIFVLTDSANGRDISSHYVAAKETIQHLRDMVGTIYLHPAGFAHPVNISNASKTMVLVINTSFLILITLWLSIIGHRKVLNYFARNDALLPLVAACGKTEFYTSLWIITLVRVGFFLLASLPATFILYKAAVPAETLQGFIGEPAQFGLWLCGILSSLSALAIISSIAELKHRHSVVAFLYKYVPVIFCLSGTVIWFFTVFVPGTSSAATQSFISSLPIVGLSPIVLGPVFPVSQTVLVVHTVLSSILVVFILRINSRWFATHLEEI